MEWNTRTASRRSNYDLGLNCWQNGREWEGSVTIHLTKDNRGRWRRTQAQRLDFGDKLRKSFKFKFPTTRPYLIPHKVVEDDDWAKIMADRVD